MIVKYEVKGITWSNGQRITFLTQDEMPSIERVFEIAKSNELSETVLYKLEWFDQEEFENEEPSNSELLTINKQYFENSTKS